MVLGEVTPSPCRSPLRCSGPPGLLGSEGHQGASDVPQTCPGATGAHFQLQDLPLPSSPPRVTRGCPKRYISRDGKEIRGSQGLGGRRADTVKVKWKHSSPGVRTVTPGNRPCQGQLTRWHADRKGPQGLAAPTRTPCWPTGPMTPGPFLCAHPQAQLGATLRLPVQISRF